MNEDDTRRILVTLATLTEGMAGLQRQGDRRDDAAELERQESHLSRKELHEKVNAAVADIAALRSDVRVNSGITELSSKAIKTLTETVDANAKAVAPTVEQFDRVKDVGKVILYVIGGGGVAFAAGVIFWGDALRTAAMHWLGIIVK